MLIKVERKKNRGFTLVELSIVLVILGLLVAGAVAGIDMLQTAKLRGVVTEVQKYKVAIDGYNETYGGLPGDLINATDYWTAAADCNPSGGYTEEAGATCNGDGDGRIGSGQQTDDTEPYTAWDQLSLAKVIPGYYSGSGTGAVVGTNSPASVNVEGGGFSLSYYESKFSYTDSLGRDFSANYIMFGRTNANNNDVSTSVIKPDDAFYMDSKLDDGTPDFGNVQAGNGDANTGNCTIGSAPNIVYNFENLGVSCNTIFYIGLGDSDL